MNLEKAIEVSTTNVILEKTYTSLDFIDAIKLGIEALKAVKHGRETPYGVALNLLPGETKE